MMSDDVASTPAIGAAVRYFREEKGWTLRELAAKLGVDHGALSRKERGEPGYRIKPPERKAMAAALGVSLDEFDAKWRASKIPQTKGDVGIPVINRAPAGGVIDMDECGVDSGQGFQYLDRNVRTQADLLFAIIVTGDSMEPTVAAGDYILFHPIDRERPRSTDPKLVDGALVRAQISQESREPGCTIARYYSHGTKIRLQKDNTKYAPIIVPREHVEQLAVAVEIRHNRGIYL